jgi:SAM-dependent methyltransferase
MGLVRRVRQAFQPDAVTYQDVILPAPRIRFCTTDWKSDEFFVRSAEQDVERLIDLCNLSANTSLLDIGSGQGRLAIGIQRRLPDIAEYMGIDVHRPSVTWCKKHIEGRSPRLRFSFLDVANARYNERGKTIDEQFRLPFEQASYDIVFAYSVFTHMTAEDVATYCKEIARVLKPGGRLFATVYVEEGVPDWEENPPGYLSKYGPHVRPLHRVRFEKTYLGNLIDAASMKVSRLDYQCEQATGQSVIVTVR